jgi:hypothetical protein
LIKNIIYERFVKLVIHVVRAQQIAQLNLGSFEKLSPVLMFFVAPSEEALIRENFEKSVFINILMDFTNNSVTSVVMTAPKVKLDEFFEVSFNLQVMFLNVMLVLLQYIRFILKA